VGMLPRPPHWSIAAWEPTAMPSQGATGRSHNN